MDSDVPGRLTVFHFSQANPKGPGQGSVPALLRRVANTLDSMPGIQIEDLTFQVEITEDGELWPRLTIYYSEKDAKPLVSSTVPTVGSLGLGRMAGAWYGVRCVFRASWTGAYEERITLWRSESFGAAIAAAESEAEHYASDCSLEYVRLAQAYRITDEELAEGVEVFSLVRDSDLPPEKYVSRFFDTGSERQQQLKDS